jgi:glutathione S-transferase
MHMSKGEGDTPEFRKISPMGCVPVLQLDNGQAITEGAAIVQYLADLKPEAKLIPPNGTIERVRAHEWLNFISTEIHKGFSPLFGLDHLTVDAGAKEILRKNTVDGLGQAFDVAQAKLGDKTFLMGEQFTVADAYLFTVLSWAEYTKVDLSKWTKLTAWQKRVAARPAVHKTLEIEGLL